MRFLGSIALILFLAACQSTDSVDTLPTEKAPIQLWPSATTSSANAKTPEIISVDENIYDSGARLEFKFSENMQRVATDAIQYSTSPNLPCSWYWTDKKHLTCDINSGVGLKPATLYTIRIEGGLYSEEGKNFGPYKYKFESQRPEISNYRTKWLTPTSPEIGVNFNLGVDSKSLQDRIYLKDLDGNKVILIAFPATEPDKDYEYLPWKKDSSWILKPAKKLQADTEYELYQDSGITTPYGPLKSKKKRVNYRYNLIKIYGDFKYTGYECWDDTGCHPEQSLRINFTAPISKEQIIQCEKEMIELGFKLYTNRDETDSIMAIPHFPSETKKLKCLSKIQDIFGRKLPSDTQINITTDDFKPYHHSPFLNESVTNKDELRLFHQSINRENLEVRLFDVDHKEVTFKNDIKYRNLSLKSKKNELLKTNLLNDELADAKSIHGVVSVSANKWEDSEFFVQKTAYNAIVQRSGRELLIFISDIHTNKPVANTNFEAKFVNYGFVGREVFTEKGKTNKFGVSVLPNFIPEIHYSYKPTLSFKLENGEEFAIRYHHELHPEVLGDGDDIERNDGSNVFWGMPDKPIYRPGDTIKFVGFLRKINGANIELTKLPKNAIVYVEGRDTECWDDECNSFYMNKNIIMDEFGRITGEFKIPKTLPDGQYSIVLDDDKFNADLENELYFNVANYKRQKVKVTVEPKVKGILTDEQFSITSTAEYYSGGPYVGANAEIALSLKESEFTKGTPKYNDFIFTPNYSEDSDDEPNSYYFNGGTLDEFGKSTTEIAVPPSRINYGEIVINSTITTDEGEVVLSRLENVLFARKPYFVGIQKSDWWLSIAEDINLESRVVALNGEEIKDVKVNYYSQKVKSYWSRFTSEDNEEQVPLDCSNSKNTEFSNNHCTFTQKQTGFYRLIAEIQYPDGSRQQSYSSHYFYGGKDKNNELVIQADKPKLKIGEMAKLKLTHGLNKASALVIIHRGELLNYWWQPLATGLNEIAFEVEEDYAPGVDVTVFVNYGNLEEVKKQEKPNYAQVIMQRLAITPRKAAPIVTIGELQSKFKPGEKIKVELNNHSRNSTVVSLAIVDESVLNQVEDNEYYKVDNSLLGSNELEWSPTSFYELSKSLYSSRYQEITYGPADDQKITITGSRIKRTDLVTAAPPVVVSMDEESAISGITRVDNLSQSIPSKTRSPSGRLVDIRRYFTDTAYWNHSINIEGNQSKQVEVKLPDNLTSWKIIAISTSKDGDIFVDDESFKTSKSIELHAEMPAQLTKDDSFLYQAEVVSKEDKLNTIKLDSSAKLRPHQTHLNQQSSEFKNVRAFERNKSKMEISIPKEGSVEVLTVAEAGNKSDALLQSTPVYSKNLTRKISYFSLLPEDKEVEIGKPKNYSSNQGKVKFELSGSVLSNLEGTFDYMKSYPHQCWEQKLSRAVVAAINIQSKDETAQVLASHIKDATNSIEEFQAPSGGMSFFGNSEQFVSAYLSAYTYKNIQYLEKKGYEFPEINTRRLRDYLINLLKDETSNMTQELAILIVNSLGANAENEWFVDGYLSSLVKDYERLGVYSRSQLLEVATQYSDDKQAVNLLKTSLLDESRVTGKKRLFKSSKKLPWYFYGFDAKSYCATITSLTKNNADKKVVNQFVNAVLELRRKNKGDFGNTLSNAYCSVAISDYVAAYEKDKTIGSYVLEIQDDEISIGEHSKSHQSSISLDDSLEISVKNTKPGIGYLRSTLEYKFDATQAPAVSNGFSITRTYFKHEDGKWVSVNKSNVNQGDFVKVSLKINNPLFRRFVAVTDTLPGSFFALDENLATSAPAELFEQLNQDYYFREKQLSPRNAKFYADYLPAGTHVVEYLVKVTHKGEFSALSAKVEEMYDDDVFATSKAAIISVH
ncbi:alpha-2-macroglobulin family protein [Aliikangiella sp. IMCC44632]